MQWLDKCKKLLSLGSSLPDQWRRQRWQDAPLLAIDLELTSLDTRISEITSIGWISGQNGQIDLRSAFYQVINTDADLQQSPVIHGLTADDIAQGGALDPVLIHLSSFMHSHIWVFHHAPLDMQILSREFRRLNIDYSGMLSMDTLRLEKYQLNRVQTTYQRGSLMLGDCRRRYQLLPAPEHNALDDAMATLELAFAQLNKLNVFPHGINDLKHTRCLTAY